MATTSYSNMIEPIVNRKFSNTFHHYNGPNKKKYVHKQKGQQYQSRPFQISKKISSPYPKEKCIGCELEKKEAIELLMHNDGKFGNIYFQRSVFYQEKGNNITDTSEQSQTCINTQILYQ